MASQAQVVQIARQRPGFDWQTGMNRNLVNPALRPGTKDPGSIGRGGALLLFSVAEYPETRWVLSQIRSVSVPLGRIGCAGGFRETAAPCRDERPAAFGKTRGRSNRGREDDAVANFWTKHGNVQLQDALPVLARSRGRT